MKALINTRSRLTVVSSTQFENIYLTEDRIQQLLNTYKHNLLIYQNSIKQANKYLLKVSGEFVANKLDKELWNSFIIDLEIAISQSAFFKDKDMKLAIG